MGETDGGQGTQDVLPMLMPSTNLSATLRSTAFRVSTAESTAVLWLEVVVEKATRENVVSGVAASRREARAVRDASADMFGM